MSSCFYQWIVFCQFASSSYLGTITTDWICNALRRQTAEKKFRFWYSGWPQMSNEMSFSHAEISEKKEWRRVKNFDLWIVLRKMHLKISIPMPQNCGFCGLWLQLSLEKIELTRSLLAMQTWTMVTKAQLKRTVFVTIFFVVFAWNNRDETRAS